ncbi:M14 metallopeptidase family protein [Aquimarina muelleri]|uniref:Peptidase M14 n=1 Tax=Aquimarina muelleri TaxID=279356 RepID=A0A918JSX8_9FLAO|nr:M14 metallopeptidase family protein [Aquimarina muelleri]MCX2761224.1 M14 family metallopeptidase [Aquimarina muelleri]GGX09181.1 peptidase M14 [Aquimarina muelleri]
MKKLITTLFVVLITTSLAYSQNKLQSPKDFLGYEVGDQFTRHADVVNYFNHVANNSNMVNYHTYGKTNERRPLTYAIVSSEENLNNIENIRLNNLKNIGVAEGTANSEIAIVWLSYNVHGNEASSTEAAMKTIYKLITQKETWLKNTVVIIDPCINPDGRDRYVNWYNQVKATPYQINQTATEHNEPWPGGRPNHYLFDLNRDWAWATQVESQQRLKIYNTWMPHVHVDFHEQGINEPYYFAPAAEPFHEIITPWQKDFQTQVGKNHARYFDAEGWLFFTRERFDLLYPSYGDTYPTFMGAIGMTYEQAGHGRAGLGIQTDEGFVLTLKDRVLHHTTTGLSTVEISSKQASKLNTEFKKFFNTSNLKYKSYILNGEADKINTLTKLLDRHEIVYGFTDNEKVSGYNFRENKQGSINAKGALVVSTNQPKGKMVKVLFEPDAKLNDPLTYDITAWSIPHAYGLDAIASTTLISANTNKKNSTIGNTTNPAGPGYIAKWNSMNDAAFMADLLKHNIRVRFSEKDFSNGTESFKKGSLIITKSDNQKNSTYDKTVIDIANAHKRKIYTASSSFSNSGVDFGSPDVKLINNQKIAVVKGKYTSSLSYGEIWHFFEQQLKYPITSIDTDYFKNTNLSNFDVLILPNGYYDDYLNNDIIKNLKKWVQKGGKLITIGTAVNTFANKEGFDLYKNKPEEKEKDSTGNLIAYDQRERESVKDLITGSIFKTKVDSSHPMAFGYNDTYFSLKLGSDSFKFLKKGYNVAYVEQQQNISGFAGTSALKGLNNSLVFGEARIGQGSVIYMVDNPLFRSFWENGKLFFVNAIFFTNNNKFTL